MGSRMLAAVGFCALALAIAAVSPAGTLQSSAAQATAAGATFVITGRGWGHGVGMSQYGALGFARRGMPYTRILAHYYPGTQIARAKTTQVRVLLTEERSSITVSAAAAFRVRDGVGTIHRLDPGRYRLGPALKVKVKGAAAAAPLAGPLTFMPGAMPLQLERPYRGWIKVSVTGKKLQAVNHVALEAYLYGVVPDEVPDSWPAEALKAQAVAARSYAMATRKTGGSFDLYADTRSQVYGGVNAETFPTTAAVDATVGQVLNYRGQPAVTYFFSTSGGRTAAIQDAWPGAKPVPYLVSVADPYDSLSPHHRWGPVTLTAAPIVRKLKLPGSLTDLRTTRNASERVTSLTAVTSLGSVSIPAGTVRRALDLRSTWFSVGVLALGKPGTAVYGLASKLTGVARGLTGTAIQQSVGGGAWQRAAAVRPAPDGTFSVSVKPQPGTRYRVAGGGAVSGAVSVAVAPLVRFFLAKDTAALRGMVRPVVAGANVQIQQSTAAGWRPVDNVTVDAEGNFQPRVVLGPGTYRARAALGRGLVPGVSPALKVVGP